MQTALGKGRARSPTASPKLHKATSGLVRTTHQASRSILFRAGSSSWECARRGSSGGRRWPPPQLARPIYENREQRGRLSYGGCQIRARLSLGLDFHSACDIKRAFTFRGHIHALRSSPAAWSIFAVAAYPRSARCDDLLRHTWSLRCTQRAPRTKHDSTAASRVYVPSKRSKADGLTRNVLALSQSYLMDTLGRGKHCVRPARSASCAARGDFRVLTFLVAMYLNLSAGYKCDNCVLHKRSGVLLGVVSIIRC